jgi:hypothetical protein
LTTRFLAKVKEQFGFDKNNCQRGNILNSGKFKGMAF